MPLTREEILDTLWARTTEFTPRQSTINAEWQSHLVILDMALNGPQIIQQAKPRRLLVLPHR
jgi:hypothetical protein